MATSTNADDFWRQQMERNRVLRRWWLQKLVKELENLANANTLCGLQNAGLA